MDCRNARALIYEYLEGALDKETRARVDAHLAECGECRRELEEARRYREAAAGLPRVKVPDDFLEGIHKKLEAETSRGKQRKRFTLLPPRSLSFGAAAAAAVVALVFVLLYQQQKAQRLPGSGTVQELQTATRDTGGETESARVGQHRAFPEGALRTTEPPAASVQPSQPSREKAAGGTETRNTPIEITLVLARAAAATAAPTTETQQETLSARKSGPRTRAVQRGEERTAGPAARGLEHAEDLAEKTGGESPGGATDGSAVSPLEKARDDLASIIVKAGGRIVDAVSEGSPPDEVLTVRAELPSAELAGILARFEGVGQVRTERKSALPESANRNAPVELRIRLTYASGEGVHAR